MLQYYYSMRLWYAVETEIKSVFAITMTQSISLLRMRQHALTLQISMKLNLRPQKEKYLSLHQTLQ